MTSPTEIKEVVGNIPVFTYSQIKSMHNWQQLFPFGDITLVLYETSPDIGHWIGLIKKGNYLEFFDPYGYGIDEEFKFIDKNMRPNFPYLLKLLNEFPGDLYFNHFKLQKMSPNIKTCGQHVAMRMLAKDMDMYKYKHLLDTIQKKSGGSYDQIVSSLFSRIKYERV